MNLVKCIYIIFLKYIEEGEMIESFIIKHDIECLTSYVDLRNTSFYFIV